MHVAIYAGAAFTDEGRMLGSLQANKDVLTQNGSVYFGPRKFRQSLKPAFRSMGSSEDAQQALEKLRAVLPVQPSIERAVFPSGQMFGGNENYLEDGQLYPLAGRRMAFLAEAFNDATLELFFALRNPGSFIPKLLMTLPEAEREDLIRSTDLSCLGWIGMVEDVRDLAPDVNITLWCNEDSPLVWGDVVRAIGGLPDDAAVNGEYDLLLSLLTPEGQQQANAMIADAGEGQQQGLRTFLAEVLEEHALPEKVEEELELPGWNSEIIDAFSELYRQELDRLGTMPGVRMLMPW